MGEIVSYPSNGSEGQGYLASPAEPGPAVVVIQEWWGLVDHIKAVCDRFAEEGFLALAPDLYRGEVAEEPDDAGIKMMSLDMERAAKDMSGAIDFLLAHGKSNRATVGVTGFCMGGGMCYILAANRPESVSAITPHYGVIPWEHAQPEWGNISARIQGHYAEHDDFAPPAAVNELESKLRALGKDVEMYHYAGAQHAFFNDDRPDVYDATAAGQAWERSVGFLRANVS